MIWLLMTIAAVAGTTAGAAYLIVGRGIATSTIGQVLLSAAAFPIVTAIVAALLIAVQFAQRTPQTHGGSFGMTIFAICMFWFYGVMASAVIGVPAAVIAVRTFRG